MPTEAARTTVATEIAEHLKNQQVPRIYRLSGGHIQPLWDAVARAGISIIDVRHEASAVYMAQAESRLTGRIGVALVTAGPGLTNAATAIANASVANDPVVVLSGRAPRPQAGRGAMQDIPQAEVVAPLCRRVEQTSTTEHVLPRLHTVTAAAVGRNGAPGPPYLDVPVDLLDMPTVDGMTTVWRQQHRPDMPPDASAIAEAQALIARARRPLVITGRIPTSAREPLAQFLTSTNAAYLDTGDSRALLPTNAGYVPAMRARTMREADLIITLGRHLDFQLAYGSSAVFLPRCAHAAHRPNLPRNRREQARRPRNPSQSHEHPRRTCPCGADRTRPSVGGLAADRKRPENSQPVDDPCEPTHQRRRSHTPVPAHRNHQHTAPAALDRRCRRRRHPLLRPRRTRPLHIPRLRPVRLPRRRRPLRYNRGPPRPKCNRPRPHW